MSIALADSAPVYRRHRPEQTVLYAVIAEHYPRFLQAIESSGGHLPAFVRQEFDKFLKCGVLEHGFLRVKCDGCRHEHLVAFSCKRRGFCPSCGARRMVESAAHLVDHVFPEAPVRQFVLTFPFPLRLLLAAISKQAPVSITFRQHPSNTASPLARRLAARRSRSTRFHRLKTSRHQGWWRPSPASPCTPARYASPGNATG